VYFIDRAISPSIGIYHLTDGLQGHRGVGASEDAPCVDLPAFLCSPLHARPITIILQLLVYTLNFPATEASKVLEYEDRLFEQLQTGELSLSDLLLQLPMEDSDSDFDD
jgi:hypothetical protein